ncbi:MAG TPA: alpha/beta fold hydrolase [Reyranella sp.]|nr:alpha/beta fold hydrolase [Reyranella sp.]
MPPSFGMIERSFITVPPGRIHVAQAGVGRPVLLLHQTPRSWDEYREVLPLLGRLYRAIAMDTLGFGDSDALPLKDVSIERLAVAAHETLQTLGHRRAVIVGHHTGAAIAAELAAAFPDSVSALVLSASPFVDAERRSKAPGKKIIDEVAADAGGKHLAELWAMRAAFYPKDRPDLLERFIVDALKAGPMAAEGHRMVDRYVMETRLPLIKCPTLVIAPTADPHAYPNAPKVAAAIKGAKLVEIAGGMVPLPDQMPAEFADAVHGFIASLPAG